MSNQNDRLFHDEQIQRFDADTIKNRYGSSWKNFASNVREIAQPDGSIVKGIRYLFFNLFIKLKKFFFFV